MTYKPEDALKKAELMALEMRRSRKRGIIVSKRALRNPLDTEEQPVCTMCGGRKEDALSCLNQTEPRMLHTHCMPQVEP